MRLDANDQWSVLTANPDGTDEQALLSSWAQLPRWSPDGRRLSVAVESPQGLVFVGLVNPDGSDYVPFDSPDPTLNLGCFVWSPDASRLACEGWDDADPTRNGLYTVRASDGGDLIRVTTSPDGAHDIPVDYSPGGLQIVLVRAIDEATTSPLVVNVDGSDEHALAGRAGRISPDGKTILTDAEGSLLLVPIDGGQPRPIMIDQAPGEFAFGGAWSPDGEWLVFSLDLKTGTHSDIYIMRKDGSGLHQVTDTPDQDEEFGGWGVAAP